MRRRDFLKLSAGTIAATYFPQMAAQAGLKASPVLDSAPMPEYWSKKYLQHFYDKVTQPVIAFGTQVEIVTRANGRAWVSRDLRPFEPTTNPNKELGQGLYQVRLTEKETEGKVVAVYILNDNKEDALHVYSTAGTEMTMGVGP